MEASHDLVLTVQDLHKQGIPYSTSTTEFIYKGKHFKKHLSFRKALLKAGLDYCKAALSREELCFLVLEENAFTIWRSVQQLEPPELPQPSPAKVSELLSSSAALPSPSSPTVEPEFLNYCRQTMTHYLGPIANQYIRATLEQFPNLTHRQLVDRLAACIADPQQSEEFWQRMLTGAPGQQPVAPPPSAPPPSTVDPPAQTPPPLSDAQFKRAYRGIPY